MSLNDDIERIVRDHHDAYLVEVFGPEHCGLPPERIAELRQRGVLDHVPPHGRVDPLTLTIDMARYLEMLSSTSQSQRTVDFLRMPLEQARRELSTAERRESTHQEDHEQIHEGHVHVHMDRPTPPDDSGGGPPLQPPKRPTGGAGDDQFFPSYTGAVKEIGAYCRGLGDVWSAKLQEWIGEEWDGDAPAVVPAEGARASTLKVVQSVVANAWARHLPANQLASLLTRETGDFSRNWLRIAETELQALFNETVVRAATVRWGAKAMIAFIPETRACTDCKRAYLDGAGLPIIFTVSELLANGTNVGKPKAKWRATLFPQHPRCRCLPMSVPPYTYVTREGYVRNAQLARPEAPNVSR